jgi:hypothetical protein
VAKVIPEEIPYIIKKYLMTVAGTDDLHKACRLWCEAADEDTPRWRNGNVAPRWMVHDREPDKLVPVLANQSGRLPGGWHAIRDQNRILKLLVPTLRDRAVELASRQRAQEAA